MLTGEVKIIEGGLADFLLLPCGAMGLSGFYVDAISILIVFKGAKIFLNNQCCLVLW
jgi:hypothetical protein